MNLSDVGDIRGVSRERVRQIEEGALRRLKAYLTNWRREKLRRALWGEL